MNFSFLENIEEYALFGEACIEAERVFATSPRLCALGCRSALELAVKWMYAADRDLRMPYRDNLQSLVHEQTFVELVEPLTYVKLQPIIRLGNLAAHTERTIPAQDAMRSLKDLFEFVEWIDYCYSFADDWQERKFDEAKVPAKIIEIDEQAVRERDALIDQQKEQIEQLEKKVQELTLIYTAGKEGNKREHTFNPDALTEFETRKRYIDIDLLSAGWENGKNVVWEYPVDDMEGIPGNPGFIDYVLMGKDGKPIALLEAKKTSYDPNKGLQQARLYRDCLKRKFGYAPFIFLSNGFETYFLDDDTAPKRIVSGVFAYEDLQRLMARRGTAVPLNTVEINHQIAGSGKYYFQAEAIRAVCSQIDAGFRKSLLVMATGTGKTRTVVGLYDVLARGNRAVNILFLADRLALVKQAKNAFRDYLPNLTVCNLCLSNDRDGDKNSRAIFSTYPTILNAIDESRNPDGSRLFSPAHFDIIIVDEAHRSIFKKYKAIFDYFDAFLVGLTATPKDEVARNTYDFFDCDPNVPTYLYEYETAVDPDHVLVPYKTFETSTHFLEEGITYDELTEEEKELYDEDWEEATGDSAPDYVPPEGLNKFLFNEGTVKLVLQDLMNNGIRIDGGERVAKTIIFAQGIPHAEFIVQQFEAMYPDEAKGGFIKRVCNSDDRSMSIIDEFKYEEKPGIVVSVDMMDTGVDVPAVANLVFFKKVRSKTKFWQMIGRGTRTCKGVEFLDRTDGVYIDKRRFYIFDYCGNFEYFRVERSDVDGALPKSISERIFAYKAMMASCLQVADYADDEYQEYRKELVGEMASLVGRLDTSRVRESFVRREIDLFRQEGSYTVLGKTDLHDLQNKIAPLIRVAEDDKHALGFDAIMYGYMCAKLVLETSEAPYKRQVLQRAIGLSKRITIPQIKEKLPEIKRAMDEELLDDMTIFDLEHLRLELRGLMRFLDDGKSRIPSVTTNLEDEVISHTEGGVLYPADDFVDYKQKVERYVHEHENDEAIRKLRNNLPLTRDDYKELERILVHELGNAHDYERAYGQLEFGLQIRKIAGLDHDAAMGAFSEFINDGNLNFEQIEFVKRVIQYVERNGYMELEALSGPAFSRPASFMKLFDENERRKLVAVITDVRNNAMLPAA